MAINPIKSYTDGSPATLRRGMLISLALMIASFVASGFSYVNAKQNITDDLNEAMIALANENSALWTRQDTIAALRQMHRTTHRQLIYQASDLDFKHATLKEEAFFTLALVGSKHPAPKIRGNKIASDSIMLVPEKATDGLAVQLQGFADCSVASVFAASDQRLPGILLTLSLLSMAYVVIRRPKGTEPPEPSIEGLKLTPMQRRFVTMLLEAPGREVDKQTLCEALWDGKSNAEESLYTLVRRTKPALAGADLEIVCNRGRSYELRVNR